MDFHSFRTDPQVCNLNGPPNQNHPLPSPPPSQYPIASMIAPLIGFLVAWETTAFWFQSLGYRRSARQLSSSSSSLLLRPPPTVWSLSSTSSPTAVDTSSKSNDDNLNTSKLLYLYNPSERDKHYQGNIAQYLLDLHHNVRGDYMICIH